MIYRGVTADARNITEVYHRKEETQKNNSKANSNGTVNESAMLGAKILNEVHKVLNS